MKDRGELQKTIDNAGLAGVSCGREEPQGYICAALRACIDRIMVRCGEVTSERRRTENRK